MSPQYKKLIELLKELFQLDQPDLDFGIYRVLHARSEEITAFLENDLLPQVKDALARHKTADKAEIKKALATAIEQAKGLGVDPESTQRVNELRSRLQSDAVDMNALEREVYDHLYRFFRRYYADGDFIARRVYKPGVYAIPYEGEEVALHWANKDQYYIKTSEYLRDYAFRLKPNDSNDPMRVHLRLVDAAEGEHGNVKAAEGRNRLFVLAPAGDSGRGFIAEEDGEPGKELVIRFEYRPARLDDWRAAERDGKKKPPTQKDLIAQAAASVLSVSDTKLARWVAELGKAHVMGSGEEADRSRLEAHLKRYTARNTFDYFIHKDLGAFLSRELDFYIKNEVMHLDDVESESAPRVEQYLSTIRVIRRIASKIIEFLAQLENFQKKLWCKKKFVVETHYCIAVSSIPEKLHAEIAANEAQRAEWIKLFAIDELEGEGAAPGYSNPLKPEFLQSHPTLLVDTRHFSDAFTGRLLEAMGDMDEQTGGILFHSENFQALSLMQAQYQKRVDCIYIDPPYNAASSEIAYKNDYKQSSWLALMQNRIEESQPLLKHKAAYAIAIDDYEMAHLCEIVDRSFAQFDRHVVVVNHHPQGGMSHNLTRTHEYMLMMTPIGIDILRGHRKSGEIEYRSFALSGPGENKSRSGRPNSFYAVLVDDKKNRIMGFEPPPPFGTAYPTKRTQEGFRRIYPINASGDEKVWCRSYHSADKCLRQGEITLNKNGALKLAVNTTDKRHSLMSNWADSKYNAGPHGTALIAAILGNREAFSYPKSLHTVRDAVDAMTWHVENPWILDFFAGSATTGHAVINLNREDGGRRKFILVEMGDYFNTVLLPRIKKVTFTPEWKDGKPKRLATGEEAEGSPRVIKYLRLESYEDTLNNLETQRTDAQRDLLNGGEAQGMDGLREQYMLRYMLDIETRDSQSLLSVPAFADPTAYKLKVKQPGSDESRTVNVDLLETFSWLIGLKVRRIAAPQSCQAAFERDSEGRLRLKGRLKFGGEGGPFWFRAVAGAAPDGRETLVIWRKLTGVPEQDNLVLDEWFAQQGYLDEASKYDVIYVNGSNNLENLKAPNDVWQARLIEADFHRLMFENA